MPKPLVMYFLGHSLLHHFSRMFLLCLLNRLLCCCQLQYFFYFPFIIFYLSFYFSASEFFSQILLCKKILQYKYGYCFTTILSKVYFLPRLSSPYRQRIHLHIVFCQRKKLDCSIVVFPLLLSYMYNARHSESFQSKKVQKKCFVTF